MTLGRTMVAEPVNAIEPAQKAWNYSLFRVIFPAPPRRRFPLGAEMPGDLAPFKSTHDPCRWTRSKKAMLVDGRHWHQRDQPLRTFRSMKG